jgi:hypothetical protein
MKNKLSLFTTGAILFFLTWIVVISILSFKFDIGAGGHLERTANANTVELAKQEMNVAVNYLKENGITNGRTSILVHTPNKDVTFWYRNLEESLDELNKVKEDSSQLEKSNMLIKLRETLMDQSEGSSNVTVPPGISQFPNNLFFELWGWVSLIFILIVSGFWIKRAIDY